MKFNQKKLYKNYKLIFILIILQLDFFYFFQIEEKYHFRLSFLLFFIK